MSNSTLSFENQIDQRQDIPLLEQANSHPMYYSMALTAIGATIGDALGSPFENKTKSEIQSMWLMKKSNHTASTGTHYVFPKQLCHSGLIYTDDTQMSISLIESYLINHHLDPIYIKTLWQALSKKDWFTWAGCPLSQYQFGGFRGTGRNFRESVNSLNEECDNDISQKTAGNGVAMRSWPCAIAACHVSLSPIEQIERLRQNVVMNGELTHKDILGIVPAYSVAWLTYQWIQGKLLHIETLDLIRVVIEETKQFEVWLSKFSKYEQQAKKRIYSTALEAILSFLKKTSSTPSKQELIDISLKSIVDICEMTTSQTVRGPHDGFAVASVTSALLHAIFLRNEDFLICLKRVIDVGGDTDTVASMVGAMVGAYKGWSFTSNRNESSVQLSQQNSQKQFSYFVVQQVVGFEHLYEFYRHFIEWTLGMSHQDTNKIKKDYCGFLLQQEKHVTSVLLNLENSKRTPHYRATVVNDMVSKIGNSLMRERSKFHGSDEEFVKMVIPKYSNEIEWMNDWDLKKLYGMVFKKNQRGGTYGYDRR